MQKIVVFNSLFAILQNISFWVLKPFAQVVASQLTLAEYEGSSNTQVQI